ncbi:hypothetical protein FACS1894120_3180 [Clostridia bacterium]|nr:hypothetical protein FACS1894120_3180 [Clostridia bacterium]
MKKKHIVAILAVLTVGTAAYVSADAVAGRGIVTADTVSAEETGYAKTAGGDGFINISGTGEITVTVSIPESDIRLIKVGQPAAVTGAAFPNSVLSATVKTLAPEAHTDPGGRTCVAVTLLIAESDGTAELRSGYSARAVIETEEPRTLLTVPYGVILQDKGGEFVYVLENGTVRRRDIATGTELADVTEVTEGLTAEDKIIQNPSDVVSNVLGRGE